MSNVQTVPAIAGFRSESATVGGVRIHYWIGGPPGGAPILLWHGFLSTSYAWRLVAPKLAEAGLRVLVPDMRGFGDSDKPQGDGGYDTRALAEEFRALVAAIHFGEGRPLTLVAHDMGAPPALIWAADHPEEIATLLYVEAPVMVSELLSKIIAYTPEAMQFGSMWWWILPLAPGVPEALIVGNERAFLIWFYAGQNVLQRAAFSPGVVDEYLRTFSGKEGVIGSMGVYRAAFTSIAQTAPLLQKKIRVPVVAIGGRAGLGSRVGDMLSLVAETVESVLVADSGHFVPEERPEEVVRHVLAASAARAKAPVPLAGQAACLKGVRGR
jgi:pimeloyl-ACP methyl ester carboxylesterase